MIHFFIPASFPEVLQAKLRKQDVMADLWHIGMTDGVRIEMEKHPGFGAKGEPNEIYGWQIT